VLNDPVNLVDPLRARGGRPEHRPAAVQSR
jgi:hypothetical protein